MIGIWVDMLETPPKHGSSAPWYYNHPDVQPKPSRTVQRPVPLGANGRNAMLVNRSTDGAWTWEAPVTLIEDNDPQILNDKNSITADPTESTRAYAVWDRLQDFTIGASGGDGAAAAPAETMQYPDGVMNAQDRISRLQAQTRDPDQGPTTPAVATAPVQFQGPTYLARTTDSGLTWEPARPGFSDVAWAMDECLQVQATQPCLGCHLCADL